MLGGEATTVDDVLQETVAGEATNVASSTATETVSSQAEANKQDTRTPNSAKTTGLINGALMIAISVISGVIGAVVYERMQPPPPRIMVLDMGALLQPIAKDPSLSALDKRRLTEDIGASLEKVMQLEAEAGAIILDASVVLKAPGESYVQP